MENQIGAGRRRIPTVRLRIERGSTNKHWRGAPARDGRVEPMRPELAERTVEGLTLAGIDFVTYLPESRLASMVPLLEAKESVTTICASHEGTSVSVACGAALAGASPAVYMEATGFVVSMYNIENAAMQLGLPLLLLVSHIGSAADAANSVIFSLWGRRLIPQVEALGLQYRVLEDGDRLETRIADMVRAARSARQPACLLFTGEFTVSEAGWK